LQQGSLIEALKGIIERTYALPHVIANLSVFIVGDTGLKLFYPEAAGDVIARGPGARVLVRQDDDETRIALYYPDALVRHLERFNPLRALGEVNIQEFAVLVEELDHLLTLATRAAERRPVTLLELEHRANVTKYLVVAHLLGRQLGRRRLSERDRLWARHQLFGRYSQDAGEDAARYRRAARMAAKYVRHLDNLSVEQRHAELRALHRRAFSETVRLLALLN
jgi:hypothetical protein